MLPIELTAGDILAVLGVLGGIVSAWLVTRSNRFVASEDVDLRRSSATEDADLRRTEQALQVFQALLSGLERQLERATARADACEARCAAMDIKYAELEVQLDEAQSLAARLIREQSQRKRDQ